MLMSQEGTVIRVPVVGVRTTGRNTMGVRVMNLRGADRISSMARLVTGSNGNGNGAGYAELSEHVDSEATGAPIDLPEAEHEENLSEADTDPGEELAE
jgi:DNA gyrase/topoisomerase IV subunit A